MVLGGLFGGGQDVGDLIAKRNYAKAIQLIRAQLQQGHADARLRVQLSDVLIMSGREREAVPVLIELADDYAAEHQAPKAIALLKKIERIEPGRTDVTARLARLIKDKAKPRPRAAYQPREGLDAAGYEPAGAVFSAEHFDEDKAVSDAEKIDAARKASWVPSTHQDAPEAVPLIDIPPEPDEPQAPVSGDAFRGQILDVIQEVLQKPPASAAAPDGAIEAELAPSAEEIAESPLFSGFAHDELMAVMDGMRLLSFQPGDIILTEGDPGDSLFVMTEGVAKAFVHKADGAGQRQVRTMQDGDFFGEISILSGKPRTATVTAATAVELLELDKATLDGITSNHPRVRQVLEEFYIARATGDDS